MSTTESETTPLLRAGTERDRKASFAWLVPILLLTALARGLSTYAEFDAYQSSICPTAPTYWPCGSFKLALTLPTSLTSPRYPPTIPPADGQIRVYFDLWSHFAAFVVTFLSIGWWSAAGDRAGRRTPLLGALLGLVLGDAVHLLLQWVSFAPTDAGDVMSVGIIVQCALGGWLGFTAAVHAYAFDVAPTPISRVMLFGLIEASRLAGLLLGSVVGHMTGWRTAYILSTAFFLLSLAYTRFVLPESLPHSRSLPAPAASNEGDSALKSIFLPITTLFFGNDVSKTHLPRFATAFLLYSFTAAGMDLGLVEYTLNLNKFPSWIPLVVSPIASLLALLGLLPLMTRLYAAKHAHKSPARVGLSFARTVTQNGIFLDLVSALGIVVFCLPDHARVLYDLLAILHPLSSVARPAFWVLGTGYIVSLGRESEVGRLLGSLSVWTGFAEVVSYCFYYPTSDIFWFSTVLLIPALLGLVMAKLVPREDEVL
ncbi:unnamed protein product [Mycena citricolor]|uniref:MFS general substrate transporter n=1 Tax=Mycena citricolor TaxID=2018698 RepID=A0AAD2K6Q3_9AGAR|nr:unnamed protein product [Mycena citricolor]